MVSPINNYSRGDIGQAAAFTMSLHRGESTSGTGSIEPVLTSDTGCFVMKVDRIKEMSSRKKRLDERLANMKERLLEEKETEQKKAECPKTRVNRLLSLEPPSDGDQNFKNISRWTVQTVIQDLLTELLPKSHSGLKKCMRRVIPTPDGRLLRVGLSGDSEGRVSHTNLCTCKTIDCYTCGPVSRVDRFLEVSKMVQAVKYDGGKVFHLVPTKSPELDDYLSVHQVLEGNKALRKAVKNYNYRNGTNICYYGMIEPANSRKIMRHHHSVGYITGKKYIHVHLHCAIGFGLSDLDHEESLRKLLKNVWSRAISKNGGLTFLNGIPERLAYCDESYLRKKAFHWEELMEEQDIAAYLAKLKNSTLEITNGDQKGGDRRSEDQVLGRGLRALIHDIVERWDKDKFDVSFDQMEDIRMLMTWYDAMYNKNRALYTELKYWVKKFELLRVEKIEAFALYAAEDMKEKFGDYTAEQVDELAEYLANPPQKIEGKLEVKDGWFPEDGLEVYYPSEDPDEVVIVWKDSMSGEVWNEFEFQGMPGIISTVLSSYNYDDFGKIPYDDLKYIDDIAMNHLGYEFKIRKLVKEWKDDWLSMYALPVRLSPPKSKNKRKKKRSRWWAYESTKVGEFV